MSTGGPWARALGTVGGGGAGLHDAHTLKGLRIALWMMVVVVVMMETMTVA